MKTLFFLLIPFLSFSQTVTQRDTIVDIGGILYLQHIVTTSEVLVDTFAIRARIDEIDKAIQTLQSEKAKKASLIGDFEDLKPLKALRRTTRQPATKPKSKN